MSDEQRDPWELKGEKHPVWYTRIEQRIHQQNKTVDRDVRWQVFIISTLLESLKAMAARVAIRTIVLYGPLIDGITGPMITLAMTVAKDAAAKNKEILFESLNQLCMDREVEYKVRIDLLFVLEEELSLDIPITREFATIARENVVIWP